MKKAIPSVWLALVLLVLVGSSCVTITRTAFGQGITTTDRTLPVEYLPDIFETYLWTSPPLSGTPLQFQGSRAAVRFAGQTLTFISGNDGALTLEQAASTQTRQKEVTANDHYYNREQLSLKTVQVSRQQAFTVTEGQWVNVQKSRIVHKSRSVYDSFSKSYRTEFYADTEWYTDREFRQVTKTEYRWVTVEEKVPDIPVYSVYRFKVDGGGDILVYQDQGKWFLQNVSGLVFVDKVPGFLSEVSVNGILLDANNDGIWTSNEDKILFSTWNPYKKDSTYQALAYYPDNQWLDLKTLKTTQFTNFIHDSAGKSIQILNGNSQYAKSNETRPLKINNLPAGAGIVINGKSYYHNKEKSEFEAPIQLGLFNLLIQAPRKGDFEVNFEVPSDAERIEIDYQPPPPAASLTLKANFKFFKMTAIPEKGPTVTVFGRNKLILTPGKNRIQIMGDGLEMEKTLDVKEGTAYTYNFQEDKLAADE